MPEGGRQFSVLRCECGDGEFAFVEAKHLAQVFHHGCQGGDQIGEGVSSHGSIVGVGEVFELAALDIPVERLDPAAHAVVGLPVRTPIREVLFVLQPASISIFGVLELIAAV